VSIYFILLFIRVLYWYRVSGRCNEEQNYNSEVYVVVHDEVSWIDTAVLEYVLGRTSLLLFYSYAVACMMTTKTVLNDNNTNCT